MSLQNTSNLRPHLCVCVGVPSVKAPESIKRRESISSEMPPSSAKPATPSIPMDTSTPRSPAVSGRIQSDPALRKGTAVNCTTVKCACDIYCSVFSIHP